MAQVIVLSQKSSEKLFGNANPVGRRIRIFSQEFQVVGVLADWHPVPRYTHLINGNGSNFSGEEEVMIPFATAINLQVPTNGSTSCYTRPPRRGFLGRLESECTWIQFWIEAKTDAAVAVVKDYIDAYTREQKKIGRFLREAPNKVYNVMEWMEMLQVVSNDNKVAVWLAFGFLLLCLVNTMGLLLAKFSVRAAEVGVRRSLGATRGDIFHQFLLESSVIGIAGGVLGLLLSFISLWLIARQSKDLSTVAHMDWEMLGLTLILAVVASVLAGLLPTWRACQVTPALQLKSQ
jgi:putative ABC transport system permease protein